MARTTRNERPDFISSYRARQLLEDGGMGRCLQRLRSEAGDQISGRTDSGGMG